MDLTVTRSWIDTGMDLSGLTVWRIKKQIREWAWVRREVRASLNSGMFGVARVEGFPLEGQCQRLHL